MAVTAEQRPYGPGENVDGYRGYSSSCKAVYSSALHQLSVQVSVVMSTSYRVNNDF